MIQQLTDGTRYRVRHVFADAIGIEADLLGHGLALGFLLITHFRLDDDPPGNADNRCARRYSLGHHSIGADLGARTDGKRTEHLRARPDYNAIFQRRVALAFVPGCAAQGHALVQGHVITNLGGLANNDAHAVVDKETTADLGARMNLNPGQPTAEVRYQPRQPFPAHAPQGAGQAMDPDRMHARVAGQHFKGIARRRVTVENTLDIFSQTLEHF